MKKVLMLGGSYFQIPAIRKAVEMGYYVITCDYLPTNPGHRFSHEYYNVSTTDKEAVLALAREKSVDGVVCYASDPAAPTAAYVCEKMGFPTSPYRSVEILSNKDLFRNFLRENNFSVPKARGYSSKEEAVRDGEKYHYPVMVKPVDSSGSKGVTKVETAAGLSAAIEYALQFSRCGRFIIEEYVEKFGYQIAGDGFSVDGKLVFRCFANEHFDSRGINPYVPVGESWPYMMPTSVHEKLHAEIQRLLTLLHMGTQAYNFDLRIDREEKVYLMEVGPRNGGNLIPQVTKYATGVDMVEYTIRAAMGEDCSSLQMQESRGFWSSYIIHSDRAGKLKSIEYSEDFRENNIVEETLWYKRGDDVNAFTGSNGTLGTLILKYSDRDEMLEKMDHMEKYVKVNVE